MGKVPVEVLAVAKHPSYKHRPGTSAGQRIVFRALKFGGVRSGNGLGKCDGSCQVPQCPFSLFFDWDGFSAKIRYRKKGTLILTSLLEEALWGLVQPVGRFIFLYGRERLGPPCKTHLDSPVAAFFSHCCQFFGVTCMEKDSNWRSRQEENGL